MVRYSYRMIAMDRNIEHITNTKEGFRVHERVIFNWKGEEYSLVRCWRKKERLKDAQPEPQTEGAPSTRVCTGVWYHSSDIHLKKRHH